MCHHFVHEYQEDGMVKIIFVAGTNNDADIFTKNIASTDYQKHAEKIIMDTSCVS